jgi:CHAT domain-containing protein/Tfp pilus assembly protein PilF
MKSRHVILLLETVLAGAVLAVSFAQTEPPASSNPPLAAGAEVEKVLVCPERHTYLIAIRAGHALHVIVTQQNVDVSLALFDPRGQNVLTVDSPNGSEGPESLVMVATMGGDHRLEVAAFPGCETGRYRLQVKSLGVATEIDRVRAAGMALYAQAEEGRQASSLAARRVSLDVYHQASEHFRKAGETLFEARARRRIGQVLTDLGEIDKAVVQFDLALELYQHVGNDWERAPLYNDVGKAYRMAGKPERAREFFERVLAVAGPLGQRPAVATAFNNLGVLYASLGEVQWALTAYDRALREWKELGNRTKQAWVSHNLGVLYISLGRFEEGFDLLSEALQTRRGMDDRRGQAVTLTAIGWVHCLQGEFEQALEAYDEALSLRRAAHDDQGEAVTLDQRGTAYLLSGRFDEALNSYRQALERVGGNRLNEAYTLVNLAMAQLSTGQGEAALAPLKRALRIFQEKGTLNGQAAALIAFARVERHLGQLTTARQHLETALKIVESVRGRLQSRWLRSSYLAVRYDDYAAYVDLLMEMETVEPGQGHAAQAFEASERARARSLLESLAEASEGIREVSDPEVLERERVLRAQINAWERRRIELLAGSTASPAHALEGKLRQLLLEYEKLQGEIRGASSMHEPRPLDLEQIRREILADETLLLAYSLGKNRSFLWVVGQETLTSHVLPPRSELNKLARQAHDLLPRSDQRGYQRQAAMVAEDLSKALLGPAIAELGNKRLLIVGDGGLHYVPFGALPVPRAESPRRPLLVDHEIVYLPSVSVLALLRRELEKRPAALGTLAVVADPVFQPDDSRLSLVANQRKATRSVDNTFRQADQNLERSSRDFGARFERLPFSGLEADAILSLVDESESLRAVGLHASRALILSGKLERYRIVHVATHGLLNDRHPALSGIVLSLFDEAGQPQEGLLRVHELFDLRLSADLVVLSACRTALGREVRGEGLVGLTHAFFYAGAARLVVSFWNVNDEATAVLMKRFYQGMLRDSLPAAQALRAAQLSMLDEPRWRAPYYWAGFALQGDWR